MPATAAVAVSALATSPLPDAGEEDDHSPLRAPGATPRGIAERVAILRRGAAKLAKDRAMADIEWRNILP